MKLKDILTFQWLGRTWQGRYAIHKLRQKEELVIRLRRHLGPGGVEHFRGIEAEHGNQVWYCWDVYFCEGLQIRNWLRRQPETATWTDHDYDSKWVMIVKEAIK